MRVFLRQSTVGREPLAVAMSGVRMGERLLQVGIDSPALTGILAAKPGLSGESSIVVTDDKTAVRARRAAEQAGAAVNISVHAIEDLPYSENSFDLVVVHNHDGQLASLDAARYSRVLSECRRVVRSGGRVVVFDKGTPTGLAALFQSRKESNPQEAIVRVLETAGFRAVRPLGDRDGYCFVEGMKIG